MRWNLPLSKLLPVLPDTVREQVAEHVGDADDVQVHRRIVADRSKTLDPGHREVLQYVSTRDIDREQELLLPEGAVLEEFRKAPQVLWGHNYAIPPIGSDRIIEADGYGIRAVTRYAETDLANDVWTLRRDGHLNTSSVGFIPLEMVWPGADGWGETIRGLADKWGVEIDHFDKVQGIYTKWLLLEHSDVSVPANINALTVQVGGEEQREFAREYAGELDVMLTKGLVRSDEMRDALSRQRDAILQQADTGPDTDAGEVSADDAPPAVRRTIELEAGVPRTRVLMVEPVVREPGRSGADRGRIKRRCIMRCRGTLD